MPLRVNTLVSIAISSWSPSCARPPTPEYSPSEFSRTNSMSTSSGPRPASGHGTPASRRDGLMFAHRSSCWRIRRIEPHSATSSGTDGWPIAPIRIASWLRATSRAFSGIIRPCRW